MVVPSRRRFLTGISAAILKAQSQSGKGQTFPSDAHRYTDAATEFAVLRLTSPSYSSHLTAYYNRAFIGRGSLLFSNDRTGRPQVYRAELRNGQTRQLTDAANLDPASVALVARDRSFCYFDGHSLRQSTLSNLHEREIYRIPDRSERAPGLSVASDGGRALFVERDAGVYRVRIVGLAHGAVSTVVESREEIADPLARPGHSQILFARGGSYWLTGYDGQGEIRLPLAKGQNLIPRWSENGTELLYLNLPAEPGQLNAIREFTPANHTDKLASKTSQFGSFGANADASVFVGASASKASPHVLILLRSTHRELTLCEHRASNPRAVAPLFTPDSQRIVFDSDLHGKPAIYTMGVERFVEETESE
jgi:oligogalacturonide lyase